MTSTQDPSPEARDNVTDHNVETRAELLPEEDAAGGSADPEAQAAAILAESEERTLHPDADEGGHRTSDQTV
ncbi:hypothetical protein SAMN05660199_03988 [Klenkia soli]|uniref:Uncharacterized protein n=1 Tax=Klenkia soli TaxID=1052260 RepID=A0A1H0SZW1_9ACTN|nr:hypothetical protein [Klenkia soli]SDP47387.1 hypothetical protein SAMN05660199_03988 [Klenkia soli]